MCDFSSLTPQACIDLKMTPNFTVIRRLPPGSSGEPHPGANSAPRGVDIIDFGMGNPTCRPPKHIVDKLIETARDPKAGRYSPQGHLFCQHRQF